MSLQHAAVVVASLLSGAACANRAAVSNASSVERGRYLVNAGGCHDCHSPKVMTREGPVPDTTRLLSGFPAGEKLPPIPRGVVGPTAWGALASNDLTAWVGPWGVTFGANLTPDATGLAGWTEMIFIQAMRTGKHMGVGRPILPPMPWPSYAQFTDDDLRAVFGYLRALRPVENVVPPPLAPGE